MFVFFINISINDLHPIPCPSQNRILTSPDKNKLHKPPIVLYRKPNLDPTHTSMKEATPMPTTKLLALAIALAAAVAFAAFASHSQISADCDRINPSDTYSPCKEDIVVRVETRLEYPYCVQEVVVDGLNTDYKWHSITVTDRRLGKERPVTQWSDVTLPLRKHLASENLNEGLTSTPKKLASFPLEPYEIWGFGRYGKNEEWRFQIEPHPTWTSQTTLSLNWQACIRKLQAETSDRQENESRLDSLRTAYAGLRDEFPESEEIAKRLHAIEYQKGLTEIEIAVYEVRILGADDTDTRDELRRILSRAQARLAQLTQAEARLLAQQAGQQDILRMLSAIQGRIEAFQSRFGSIALDPLPETTPQP